MADQPVLTVEGHMAIRQIIRKLRSRLRLKSVRMLIVTRCQIKDLDVDDIVIAHNDASPLTLFEIEKVNEVLHPHDDMEVVKRHRRHPYSIKAMTFSVATVATALGFQNKVHCSCGKAYNKKHQMIECAKKH